MSVGGSQKHQTGFISTDPLKLATLGALMDRTSGSLDVSIAIIDGPVRSQHPGFEGGNLREIAGGAQGTCNEARSAACVHGTFVAGILSAKRNSPAPSICPGCTLLIRPIFEETTSGRQQMPNATPHELAAAILDCIDGGARVINLSLALVRAHTKGEQALKEALDYAVKRNVIVVAAAGNEGTLGTSVITSHPWVIPVIACDLRGRPLNASNLGNSIGRRGLSAPGEGIVSLGAEGQTLTLGGTSAAAPFVTGTVALLWSLFPSATATQIKIATTRASAGRRTSAIPPLLDAEAAYQILLEANQGR